MKNGTQKSFSPRSRLDSASSYSPLHKDDDGKVNKRRMGHSSYFCLRTGCHRKTPNRFSPRRRSAEMYKSPSDSNYDMHSTHNRSQKAHRSKDDEIKGLHPVNIRFWEALDYHNYLLADKGSKYDHHVAKTVAKWLNLIKSTEEDIFFDSFDPT